MFFFRPGGAGPPCVPLVTLSGGVPRLGRLCHGRVPHGTLNSFSSPPLQIELSLRNPQNLGRLRRVTGRPLCFLCVVFVFGLFCSEKTHVREETWAADGLGKKACLKQLQGIGGEKQRHEPLSTWVPRYFW